MSEPVITARVRELSPADTAHPLATQNGVDLLMHIIEADKVWRGCTKPQRVLLGELCPPLVERLVIERKLSADDMPLVARRKATLDALRRRGLVDDQGRLTAVAVHTWYWRNLFGAES